MELYCYIFTILCIQCYFSFKIGTFNTNQAQTGGVPSNVETIQIDEISSSDIDVICLQELLTPRQAQRYQANLEDYYPDSISGADSFDFTMKTPCSPEQKELLENVCVQDCANLYWGNSGLFAYCMGTECQNQLFPLLYTSCLNCVGFCSDIPGCPGDTIQGATGFCSNPDIILPPFDWIDGTAILSKYPILNNWTYDIPSWLSQRAISLVEIDICSVTHSESNNVGTNKRLLSSEGHHDSDSDDNDNGVCDDTMIVGCVHLKDCDQINPELGFFPTSQDQINLGIDSFVGLNAYQSTYILENVLNKNVAPWIHDGEDHNVVSVFIAGDYNVGKLLNSDNFAIWKDAGFVSGRNVRGLQHVDNRGTYNADPDSELPNELAYQFCVENYCFLQDSDFDHVLVKNKKRHHHRHHGGGEKEYNIRGINGISYKRVFTELFDVNQDGNMLPLSEHWGIEFEFEFKKKRSDE